VRITDVSNEHLLALLKHIAAPDYQYQRSFEPILTALRDEDPFYPHNVAYLTTLWDRVRPSLARSRRIAIARLDDFEGDDEAAAEHTRVLIERARANRSPG